MATETKTFNLTPLVLLWTIGFGLLYFLTDNSLFVWVAALPWILMFGFAALMFGAIGVIFLAGGPVTVTRGTRKTVHQRGRAPRRVS